MNIKEAILTATKRLSDAGIDNPAMEARILLGFILQNAIEHLLAHPDQELISVELELFESCIQRRLKLEPIAYITGKKEFFGREFMVTKDTLIPRPDSETLIETILSCYSGANPESHEMPQTSVQGSSILELGVGSGCLIITTLLEIPEMRGVGVDIDPRTLAVAKSNRDIHGIRDRLELIESDWFSNLPKQKFDIITSNPPYIDSNEYVAKETLLHEPHGALFGGMSAYEAIALAAKNFMKPRGRLYLEIGYDQEKSVTNLFEASGYRLEKSARDLGGHVRCLVFTANRR